MASEVQKTFELQKANFKSIFGKNFDEEPQLFTQYVQTVYLHEIYSVLNKGIGSINGRQQETLDLIRIIIKELPNRR